jgi:hypothetical protein
LKLRTGRARFPGNRLKQALKACWSGLQECWSTIGGVWQTASAVGMDETDGSALIRRPGSRVDGDRLAADRLAHGGDPLFPLVGVLRLLVGVKQQAAADSAAGLLCLQQRPALTSVTRRTLSSALERERSNTGRPAARCLP